ncbi:hypothetical protein GCM10009817_20860 [Terrabacter lapilli]|uniref:HEPN domain-containing protein n=1 Tax=Terrabacter lapilli TaxID=436231 RepID=A0ABN2S4P1_9MICO
MSALSLLDQAQAVLEGATSGKNRIACWIARAALEEAVRDRLRQRGRPPGGGSMRSLLTCFEVAFGDDPRLIDDAEYSWAGLSRACHHHAFELAPTGQEAQRLIEAARRVAGAPA